MPTPSLQQPEVAPDFNYASEELDAMARAVNYYHWIWSYFSEFCGDDVLEVGAGIGTFSAMLLQWRPHLRIECLEPAANNYRYLSERFQSDPRVVTRHSFLEVAQGVEPVSTVVAVNVMEHVPDDREFVSLIRKRLQPGGHFLLFVPALPWIYGEMDRTYEHFRRYTRGGVEGLLRTAGFEICQLRYMNMVGAFSWWFYGCVLRRKTLNSADAARYDRWIVPWLRKLESGWSPPFGQSVLAVARVPGSALPGV